MDKTAIKKYAVWARNELITRVGLKANQYGILSDTDINTIKDTSSINGRVLGSSEQKQLKALLSKMAIKGYEQTIEEVAYTWFNRFTALRFMEVNGYLPSHIRVFTDETNDFKPQILDEAINLDSSDFPDMNMQKIMELKQANKAEELYKYLIILQCNALNSILPRMFQKLEDYTELLLPDGLLYEGSIIHQLITEIPEEDWKDAVQIIGWMYQYYNTEPKDAVFDDLKKNIKVTKEKIPAATQIFTPDWIVRYMVENSLGRLWLEGHPCENLKSNWRYYLDEAQQEPDIRIELDNIRNHCSNLKLEDIKCIDPCMGSGHILCYMFDVLEQIYEEAGYNSRDAVECIVENNLFGLDIDERAAQLAYFSVMMKARQYDKRFFSRNQQPHILAIAESNDISKDVVDYFINNDSKISDAINKVIYHLKNARELGSLLSISYIDFGCLYNRVGEIMTENSLYQVEVLENILPLIQLAEILFQKYDVVITNPPYMGCGGMNQDLANFLKENYSTTKTDLFAAFMKHGLDMTNENGYSCMVTMQNWMFIPSFEEFRKEILEKHSIIGLLHMDNQVMGIAFGTSVSVFRKNKMPKYIGNYCHVKYQDIVDNKPITFPVEGNRFVQISADKFNLIPGSPVAYWISKELLEAYQKGVIGDQFEATVGIQTGDNDRFLKYWFEVPLNQIDFAKDESNGYIKRWYPHPKGGSFRKWYGNYDYVVNWQNDGEEIHEFNKSKASIKKYNRNGICWSHTTNGAFSARKFYKTSIPNIENPVLFCDGDIQKYLIALLNSKVANYLLNMINSTMHYHVGDVLHLPLLNADNIDRIETISDECVELAKTDWDSFEFSWNFKRHPFLDGKFNFLSEAYKHWSDKCMNLYQRFVSNEELLNDIFIPLYGLQTELTSKIEERHITVRKPELLRDIKSFLSYAVGCMFGRYSLDYDGLIYSGGEWDSGKYSSFIPESSNIISVSDNGYFSNDIIDRLEEFLIVAYGKESIEDNLSFIANALGGKGTSRQIIRDYFLDDFFADHCRIYQKRPIYWLFDSGKKNGFKCLIYMHRYQADTIARIRTDYIHPMQGKYRLLIEDCEKQIEKSEGSTKVKLSKNLKLLHDQAEELRLYEEKIHHLADSMLSINLDDGVKHNYALFQSVLAKIK